MRKALPEKIKEFCFQMKKVLWISIIAILLSALWTGGCQDGGPAPGKDAGARPGEEEALQRPEKVTNFTFWTFIELHRQFWEDATKTWNEDEPERQIALNTEIYPYDVMHNKLQIALQSGTGAPDIVDIELTRYPAFLKGNISLASLNNIIIPIKDKLIISRFDIYSKNNNYYGIDYHIGSTVAFYNKEILDKAGVNPDDIKLWSDFVEAGRKVVAKTGKPMTTIEVTNMWSFYPLISQQGSDYLNKDGSVQLDNEINIKTLQFLKDLLYKDKIAVAAPGGEHDKEEYFDFMNRGGAASVIMPIWYMGRFTDYMPDLKGKIAVRPMPAWKEGGSRSAGMGGTGTSITNQCTDLELAMDFLAASKLTEKAAVKAWTILGFDPLITVTYGDPAFFADNKYTEYFGKDLPYTVKSVIDETNSLNVGDLYTDAATGVARVVLFKALKEQSQTPKEALRTYAEELRKKSGLK
jgi:arabinosaccharide transport system substrate-binding protein